MQRVSCDSLRMSLADYERLDALMAFNRGGRDELTTVAMALFGSLVKGNYYLHSDADVCVILREPEVDWHEGYERVARLNDEGIIQPIVYGHDQVVAMLREANALALEVCHHGWVLVGDKELVNRLEETFEWTKRAYMLGKTESAWNFDT